MADKSPLRRWKPFFPAFGAIDASIEAAAPECCSRDKYRQVRGEIVELLCDCDAADGGRAEELCRLLDVAMAEALETLRVVPVTPAMLTTTDVARAVGGLLGHECGRVRGLARAVVSGWRASLEAALGTLLQISLDEHEVAAAAAAAPETVRRHWLKQEISSKPWPGSQTWSVPTRRRCLLAFPGHGDGRVRNEETAADRRCKAQTPRNILQGMQSRS
ncbi:uncharacterized protein LOC8071639 [Sorghum bicolor]|jgi:hypothetical protein|uniref:uncharacterized protein LOC8071639 n=1 Tax=Sorghum bicolor TaxID=4558 RepID=UPI0001A8575B|nr:uncharacterized protein LOC8071639 [Sorghum bicolor]|eukprot:XP_002451726.1 uncharacterized protein LOC8071639 [Sorghum bicolor]